MTSKKLERLAKIPTQYNMHQPYSNFFQLVIFCFIVVAASGCISREKLNYFQDAKVADSMTEAMKKIQQEKINQIRIRPFDILSIQVSSLDEKTDQKFNQLGGRGGGGGSGGGGGGGRGGSYRTGFSVTKDGKVDLPVIGKVNVLNLTIQQAKSKIQQRLANYVREPYVRLKFLNYKIFVLGEVKSPGLITINNEQATIMEAISVAGGLGRFARRENVRVFRGTPQDPIVHELDMTSISAMNSPGYFVQPYDIIYVEPLRRKNILSNINTINAVVGILNTSLSFLFIFLSTNQGN